MKTFSYRQIWQVAYPILISSLMENLIGITDTAFLGRVGEVALGGSALGVLSFTVIFMAGLGFSAGAQILMAKRNGARVFSDIGGIFYHSISFLMLVAAALFGLTLIFGGEIMSFLVKSPDVLAATVDYLDWRVLGFFFAFAMLVFRSFFVATMNTSSLTLNSIVMLVSNVVFNYLLIFGKFGFPEMGVAGAALGSALAEGVAVAFFVVQMRRSVDLEKYGLNRVPRFRFSVLREILGLSVWTMLQDVLSLATWFVFFLGVERLGESELAVSNIIRNVSSIVFMASISVSLTAQSMVANLIGAREPQAVWPMLRRSIRMCFFLVLPVILLVVIFPEFVLGIFTDDAHLIAIGVLPLIVMLTNYIFGIPAQILIHAVAGTGNTFLSLVVESISLVFYMIFVFAVVFNMKPPLAVAWCSEYVYNIIILVVAFVCLVRSPLLKSSRA